MKIRDRFFEVLSTVVTRHTGKVLAGCLLLMLVMIGVSTRLGIKTQFADMMPKDIPMIQEYLDVIEDYSSDATVMITIESGQKDLKRMHQVAEDLAARLNSVYKIQPSSDSKLTLSQRVALFQGKFPEEISYDTLNLVRRIDYKVDNEFFSRHGMIVQKTKDLQNTLSMFRSLELPELIENINNNFEKEYIEDSENLTTLDGEAQAVQGLDGINKFVQSIAIFLENGDSIAAVQAVSEFLSGPQYMISADNTMLLMMLQPAVSFNEFEKIMYLGYRIDDTLKAVSDLYPDVNIGRTGIMMMQIDENDALANDFSWPSVIALGLILVLLIGSFKDWKYPLLAVFSLVVGIIWTAGILALVFRYLNVLSAGFGIVLIGLGIDFGIHFISGFKNGQEQGLSVNQSLRFMYNRVGAGVITGAFTTAIVFFCLPFTRFEAYSQLGVSVGIGIVTVLLSQMILLPALMVWNNKGYSIIGNLLRRFKLGFIVTAWNTVWGFVRAFFSLPVFSLICKPLQFGFLTGSGKLLSRVPVSIGVLAISVILLVFSIFGGLKMEWEYDLMKLQPQGTPGQITQDKIISKFQLSPDFALVKARNLDECRHLVEHFKKVGNRTGLIGSVDAITEFLPEQSVQQQNVVLLEQFRNTLGTLPALSTINEQGAQKLRQELTRLHQNIVEIGELSVMSGGEHSKVVQKCDQITGRTDDESSVLILADRIGLLSANFPALSRYQQIASGVLREKLFEMSGTDLVTFETLPDVIRKRYVNQRNSDLLINVYPKGYIWEENRLRTFNEQTAKVSDRTTGMPAILQLMMDLMAQKGKEAMVIGSMAVLLFLLIDFRSIKYTVLAAIPLAIGVIWMLGLMAASGMKLSIMNFTALPLIIGIGIDDGVHILHRYRIEGRGSLPRVLKFTGRAILLTSLTTMIGFGSMGLGTHAGMVMFGMTLFYGVGACFFSSAYVLPAIITLHEKIFTNKEKQKTLIHNNQSDAERSRECV